jgi:Na+/pantothenate symporter
MGHLPAAVQIVFLIALISALFPSADGAITALTSTFCIDILGIKRRDDLTEQARCACAATSTSASPCCSC